VLGSDDRGLVYQPVEKVASVKRVGFFVFGAARATRYKPYSVYLIAFFSKPSVTLAYFAVFRIDHILNTIV
jgi:hypothetical protein